MLTDFLYADWDEAPAFLNFSVNFLEALEKTAELSTNVLSRVDSALRGDLSTNHEFYQNCLLLFAYVPAIVNVTLNYKICVEQGLPLHPTYYFEVKESERFQATYSETMKRKANELFLEGIRVSRLLYELSPRCTSELRSYMATLPDILTSFIYTSTQDKYTWRGSEPEKIHALEKRILNDARPDLIIGAAHGSIVSALVLSCFLQCPLYFVRFSLFKRNDEVPVISPFDRLYIEKYAEKKVLLFDEDVSGGRTMTLFSKALRELVPKAKTASVIRHGLASFKCDYAGKEWFD